jgi:hypothetical protein
MRSAGKTSVRGCSLVNGSLPRPPHTNIKVPVAQPKYGQKLRYLLWFGSDTINGNTGMTTNIIEANRDSDDTNVS